MFFPCPKPRARLRSAKSAGRLTMSRARAGAVLLCMAVFCSLPTGAAQREKPSRTEPNGSKPKPDLSDQFFTNGPVPFLKIEIKGTNLAALQRNNRAYARATLRDGDTVYPDIGIHLKGAAGSFRDLNDRPALTINFDRYQDRQKFHGLDKIHLNNSVQDPSYMTELICGELFRAAGVPAARTTHARVELNGRDLGLYVLKEGFNKTFLRRYFKNVNGNLFDGGFLAEITAPLQKMSGTETNGRASLTALAAAAQEPDPVKRLERLDKVLDMDRFISLMAMEVMTWHWDGYTMKKNNYRVYHDPGTGKAVFFAHGMDQMFWEPNGPIIPMNAEGLVAQSILQTTVGRRRYRERVGALLTNVFRVEWITNRMSQVQARVRPTLAAMSPDLARNYDGALNNLRNQIVQRAASIAQQLNVPEPKPMQFDASGRALLTEWRESNRLNTATLDKTGHDGKAHALHIRANGSGQCISSWRAKILLPPGQYRLEGLVCTAEVAPLRDQKGEGAGLRISGTLSPRPNSISGNTPWRKLDYEFPVMTDATEVDLICELRAMKGEAWFDLDSLRLVRQSK